VGAGGGVAFERVGTEDGHAGRNLDGEADGVAPDLQDANGDPQSGQDDGLADAACESERGHVGPPSHRGWNDEGKQALALECFSRKATAASREKDWRL
jgi:hypothetical protein